MRYEDRECTVRAAALESPVWRAVGRVLVPGLVAMAAWWYWTATASAETAGTVDAPSADAGPVAAAPNGTAPDAPSEDLLVEVPAEPVLLDVEPVVDVLTSTLQVVEPVADGLVDGVAGELRKVHGLGQAVHELVTPPPPHKPAVTPAPPRPRPRPHPAAAPLPRVAAGATTLPGRDERAWAPRPTAAPSVVVPTPAAGTPPAAAPADALRPGRPMGPDGPRSAVPHAGPADSGLRTDRGPLLSGTPGALAALVAATTAARVRAAVEALEDRPGRRPPTTPD